MILADDCLLQTILLRSKPCYLYPNVTEPRE